MTDVALYGKLIDLKEAVVETIEEKWQTDSLKKQIEEAGLRKKGFMMPLDAENTTQKDIQLVKQFMPEIQLLGWELRSERTSKAWGGAYFRVIEHTEREKSQKCIQWIYVWTKQRFFISLWMTVFPLFMLGLIATLIYSYLSFTTALVSIVLIGGIFFLLGFRELFAAIRGLAKGKWYFSNGQLFLIFGAVFWLLLAEIYLSKGSGQEDLISGAESWHILPVGQEIIDNISSALSLERDIRISWVAIVFFIATLVALFLWKWEPPAFTHVTHDMDWAPFFIYISKEPKGDWKLDKVRYDSFHYYAETLTIDQLKRKNALTRDQRPRFEISNFWHSFRPTYGLDDRFKVVFGFLIFIITLAVAAIAFIGPSDTLIASDIIRFVFVPLLLMFGAYLVFASWPKSIVDKKIDLSDPIYHLTDNRLRIFWNLRGTEPALKVRSKMQDAFMDDEDFGTFRDDLEQIVFYNLLPKLRELEQKEFFKGL